MLRAVLPLACTLIAVATAAAQTEDTLALTTPRMNGPAVVDLQRFLTYHGYFLGADGIDGWFGPATDHALRQYQTDAGMQATGVIRLGDLNMNLRFGPTMDGLIDGPVPADVTLAEVWPDTEFRTYFGSFRTESYFTPPVPMFRLFTDGVDLPISESDAELGYVSPTGQFVALEQVDFYAGSGASGIRMVDLVSRREVPIPYSSFPFDREQLGLRDTFYDTELRWIGAGQLAVHLVIDYVGESGHPGIDSNREAVLGELWGVSDPIDLGWYLVSMNTTPIPDVPELWILPAGSK